MPDQKPLILTNLANQHLNVGYCEKSMEDPTNRYKSQAYILKREGKEIPERNHI